MPRISGVVIPENKRIVIALTYMYGIGSHLATKILTQANIDLNKKAKDLTEKELADVKLILEAECKVEGELKRHITSNVKRLKEIKCWRGSRHASGLPVRGQKTRKNSRTVRGNVRKTVGSGRKGAPAPK